MVGDARHHELPDDPLKHSNAYFYVFFSCRGPPFLPGNELQLNILQEMHISSGNLHPCTLCKKKASQ